MRNIIFGIILVTLSTAGLALTLWRFALLQQYVPFLLRWGGRWGRGFPATRIGFGVSCMLGITIGCFSIDSDFKFLPATVWRAIVVVLIVLVIAAGIHDYVLHRKRRPQ